MSPHFVDYAGVGFALIGPTGGQTCEQCGRIIPRNVKRYRTKRWGANNDRTITMHQKCLIGQIDPTVWDIPIGGRR